MPHLLVKHKVREFDVWKAAFDRDADRRQSSGSLGGTVYCSIDDPHEVTVLLEWDNVANINSFMESPELKATMESAGVMEQPTIWILDSQGNPAA